MPSDIALLPPNPFSKACLLSRIVTFGWLSVLFQKGNKRPLKNEDFYQVPETDSCQRVTNKLERCWVKEKESAKRSNRKPKLYRAVVKYLGKEFLLVSSGIFLEEMMRIGTPYFIGRFISYFVPGTKTTKLEAYISAAVIIFFQLGCAIIHHPNFFFTTRYGMQLKIALGTLVYKKAMRLSQAAYSTVSTGHIVNLVTSDVQILERVTLFLSQLVISPVLVIITAWVSWYELGPFCLPGILLLIMLAPLQIWLGRNFAILRNKTARLTDQRFKVMNEVISGMRVIKMYNWETPFSKLVADIRRREVNVIKKAADLKSLNGIFYSMCIGIIGLVVFVPYVMAGHSLSAEKVFTVLGMYYSVRVSLTIFLPECIRAIKEGIVSTTRIQTFLQLENKKPIDSEQPSNANNKPSIVEVKNITAQWNKVLNTPTLNDLSFTVNLGDLFMVVGPVGSGKSSLLQALLGELPVTQGTIQAFGQISYAAQQSWIFSGTIRENILFDHEYDEKKYLKVVKACALEKDFKLFADGDNTLVGERGVALSGGQKARINLARASYFDGDIILLDDPLSAVDTHVGRQLFDECICGILKARITILVTHQLQYLKGATRILCLQDGRCVGQGTLEELNEVGLDVVSLMSMTSIDPTECDNAEDIEESHDQHEVAFANGKVPLLDKKSLMNNRSLSVQTSYMSNGKKPALDKKALMNRRSLSVMSADSVHRLSQFDITGALSVESLHPDIDQDEEEEKEVMKPEAEKQTTGRVTWRVYLDYFRAGSSCPGLFFTAALLLASQAIVMVAEWWLAEWADREDYNTKLTANATISTASLTSYSRNTYIIVYAALIAGGIVISGLSCVTLFRLFVTSSQNLHNNMFHAVLKTPVYFFDTNPVGRVLNRFAKDISQMDELLPNALFDFLRLSLLTFSILLLNVVSIPYLLVGAVPMVLGFGYLRNYYLRTSRDIKRLEAINRSPVYSHISASIDGLTTIRAFEAETRFINTYYDYLDFHTSSYFLFLTTQRWLGFRLDMICALFMALSVIGSLVTLETGTAISASVVGLCLIYAKMLTGMFQWCTRQSAEVENLMTSVERVVEYSQLEPESEPWKPLAIPQGWPQSGTITAENVFYSHHKSLPFVLKDLNFDVKPQEKVGIVGRTGAGKSSLLGMLFRLNIPEGLVQIDSLPITDIKLHDLRSAIAIIPQDPVLFSGSLRKNLDPFGNYSDEDLWNSLEEVQLKEAIEELPDGVETHLAEAGSNFSVGQRQLICLARAILSHNKILVIDEATANVDNNTDSLIQETIRNKFKDCTVLTIAHRLNTIMDSDRVMVLEEGRLVEFDEPFLLLKRKTGVFTQLVDQTGPKSADVLRETARQAYELRHDDTHSGSSSDPDDAAADLTSLDESNREKQDDQHALHDVNQDKDDATGDFDKLKERNDDNQVSNKVVDFIKDPGNTTAVPNALDETNEGSKEENLPDIVIESASESESLLNEDNSSGNDDDNCGNCTVDHHDSSIDDSSTPLI